MDASMTFNWIDTRRASTAQARHSRQQSADRLARENLRLAEENDRLRRECADLKASAEMWIRLYEAALARAQAPVAVPDREPRGPAITGES